MNGIIHRVAILLLAASCLCAGCASTPSAAEPRCPVCKEAGIEGALCVKCTAVITSEGKVVCPECGKVPSGTWCKDRTAFHFSDDGSKCCGHRRGEWDNDWGCAKMVGLEGITYCEDCEQPYPIDGSCKCGQ